MSLLSRLRTAYDALLGRESRSVPTIDLFASRGMGIGHPFKPQESLRAYGDNTWLYRAVQSIAMEIASTQFKLRKPKPKGQFTLIEKHQALDTLHFPQPTKAGKSMLSGMDLQFLTGLHLMLNGEAFWLLEKRMKMSGSPTFITPLLPQFVFSKLSDDGELLEYTYRLPTREVKLDPLDVVHFNLPDPENIYRGHSPVQGIRHALDTHKKADILNTKRLDNHAVPAGTLETDQNPGEDQRKKLQQQWKQTYAGAENSGKVAMLPNGFKFNKIQETNQEMQYVEGKNVVRDEILATYGVGMEILGRTESQTRANAEASIFVFERFGVLPFLKKFNDTLNNDYLVAFPGTDGLEFTFDDPVPENMEEKRLNAQTLFALGAATPNELRQSFGQEPLALDGMDVPYLDLGKVPIGTDPLDWSPTPTLPAA